MAGTTGSQAIPYATLGDNQRDWPAKSQAVAERVDELLDALGASGAVTTAKIADGAVTTAKLADSAVTAAKIADATITAAKVAGDVATQAELDAHAAVDGDNGHIAQQTAITDASVGTITNPADTPVDADALRDDLVTNTLTSIQTQTTALETKVNAILTALRSAGVIAS